MTFGDGATSWCITLKPREWIIFSSVADSNSQKHGMKTNNGKHMFKHLQRSTWCCTSLPNTCTDCCERVLFLSLNWREQSIDLFLLRCAAIPLQTDGIKEGPKAFHFGACSQMHTLCGLLMVLQRRAQFCLDCLRIDSSGQLASL